MGLHAVYSDRHPEIDIRGDGEELRMLAAAIADGQVRDVPLARPPEVWAEEPALDSIRIEPSSEPQLRISFARVNRTLIISGNGDELARIVAGSIDLLADGPATINTVGAHIHLDPTSDPEQKVYAPGSASLVVGFAQFD